MQSKKTTKIKCTCDRRGKDMDKDEHYITCPTILTKEVLAVMGMYPKKEKQ